MDNQEDLYRAAAQEYPRRGPRLRRASAPEPRFYITRKVSATTGSRAPKPSAASDGYFQYTT